MYRAQFTYEIPDVEVPHNAATTRSFPCLQSAVPDSQPSTTSESEPPIEAAATVKSKSAAESTQRLVQQHLIILSKQELEASPELFDAYNNFHPLRPQPRRAVTTTAAYQEGMTTSFFPPLLKELMSTQPLCLSPNGVHWDYYLVILGGPVCYFASNLNQLYIHAGEVFTRGESNSAGGPEAWSSRVRISTSDEFRKMNEGRSLMIRVEKCDQACTVEVRVRALRIGEPLQMPENAQVEQSPVPEVAHEELEIPVQAQVEQLEMPEVAHEELEIAVQTEVEQVGMPEEAQVEPSQLSELGGQEQLEMLETEGGSSHRGCLALLSSILGLIGARRY